MQNLGILAQAFGWQVAINCYEDEDGRGIHGDVDWSRFQKGRRGITTFAQHAQEGYYGVADIPGIGLCGVIGYEGSSNKDNGKDWKRNFDAQKVSDIKTEAMDGAKLQVPYGNTDTAIRCHKGGYEAYQAVRTITRDFAEWCYKRGYGIWVGGHSLGGGVTHFSYIDLHYMLHTEMGISQERMKLLTGYACASFAPFNWAGAVSFNKRANGNFNNVWYGNDPVHDVPPFTGLGFVHCNNQKRLSNLRDNLLLPFVNVVRYATLGFLPSLAVWDHDPRKGFAAVQGRPVPIAKLDSRK